MQYSVDAHIINGHLELNNLPFENGKLVKVVLVPKVTLSEMSFKKAQKLTADIKGDLSDDINKERQDR